MAVVSRRMGKSRARWNARKRPEGSLLKKRNGHEWWVGTCGVPYGLGVQRKMPTAFSANQFCQAKLDEPTQCYTKTSAGTISKPLSQVTYRPSTELQVI